MRNRSGTCTVVIALVVEMQPQNTLHPLSHTPNPEGHHLCCGPAPHPLGSPNNINNLVHVLLQSFPHHNIILQMKIWWGKNSLEILLLIHIA